MSFKVGGSSQNSSQTSVQTLDPQYANALYGNLARAQALANTPFQPYSGQRVADFAPAQQQAQAAYTNIGQGQTGAEPLSAAIGAAGQAAAYQPRSVGPAQLSQTDLSPYLNPFGAQVIDRSMADLDRQQRMGDQSAAAQATSAGAFGGSRSAVLQNLNDDSFIRAKAQTLAGLNQQNYAQAQSAAQADLARRQSADQANQSAGLQGEGLNLSAAGALSSMGGQQLSQALQRASALNSAGDAQQQNQQAQLDAAYEQWKLAQQYPIQMQDLLDRALGLIPQTGTTRTTGQQISANANAAFPWPFKS